MPLSGNDFLGDADPISTLDVESILKKEKNIVPSSIYLKIREESKHKVAYFRSGRNWASKFFLLAMAFWLFQSRFGLFFFITSALIVFFTDVASWENAIGGIEFVIFCWLGCFILWKFFGWIGSLFPDDKWFELNRTTGMLHIPEKGGKIKTIPFSELEPRIFYNTMGSGKSYHSLKYVHCKSDFVFNAGERFYSNVYLRAAYLEQFMDITQPLPDIPILESFRERDPTTVVYDKLHKRDPNFWRNKTKEEIQLLAKAKREEVKALLGKDSYRL